MTKAEIERAADRCTVLESKQVGVYVVEVYLWKCGPDPRITPVYRVMLGGAKVRCMTRDEERRYPKRPAWAGQHMVKEWAAKLGLEER